MRDYGLVLLIWAVLALESTSWAEGLVRPFEAESDGKVQGRIDAMIFGSLAERGLAQTNLCSDEVFVRRVYLDLIGTLPTAKEVRQFLDNDNSQKRAMLIDELVEREEFVDYWTLKWCDVLRVKAEFPINLWPNAVQAYRRWVYEAIRDNMPYDKFAQELLTSNGSNFRVGQVNFYRAMQGHEPGTIADSAALTFMGVRLGEGQAEQRAELAKFFSRVAFKGTAEWKEEIVYLDPRPVAEFKAVLPDGEEVSVGPDEDPRAVFAKWLTANDNRWFAKNAVNRIWAWVFGRGLIHEPDDIRDDNPATYPEVLAYLEKELVRGHYDLRHIYRLIFNSQVYQQSSIAKTDDPDAAVYLACYPVRRLDAEVLIDALNYIGDGDESYSSAIPEPFTFVPEAHRSIELEDGSITSMFLEMFGRPTRDTGMFSERNLEISDEQRLYLLNSRDVQDKVEKSQILKNIYSRNKRNKGKLLTELYLTILSRYPTEQEETLVNEFLQQDGVEGQEAAADVAWALINSKEFLYRH